VRVLADERGPKGTSPKLDIDQVNIQSNQAKMVPGVEHCTFIVK